MSIHDDINIHGKPIQIITAIAAHIHALETAHNQLVDCIDEENKKLRIQLASVEARLVAHLAEKMK